MDKKSILGYSVGSPYRSNPYLDIKTPEGWIDMSNTDMPLLGMDETGMVKMMMPFSGMHKFRGKKVRELPMAQKGMMVPPIAPQFVAESTSAPSYNLNPFTPNKSSKELPIYKNKKQTEILKKISETRSQFDDAIIDGRSWREEVMLDPAYTRQTLELHSNRKYKNEPLIKKISERLNNEMKDSAYVSKLPLDIDTALYMANYQMLQKYGQPDIDFTPRTSDEWSYYTPITRTITLKKSGDLIDELPHVKQHKDDGLGFYGRFVKDWVRSPFFNREMQLKQYDLPGTIENEAHSVISPKLDTEYYKLYGSYYANKQFKKGGLTPEKAHEMLQDGTAHGKPLTDKQKKYFGMLYGRSKMQAGGMSKDQIWSYLFDDDEDNQKLKNTAPSTEELQNIQAEKEALEAEKQALQSQKAEFETSMEEEQAMQLATTDFGVNQLLADKPAQGTEAAPNENVTLDPTVIAATNELLQNFPSLRITSTIRSWGDKDAHPRGRAVDVAGADTDKAYEYYKNIIVPKYKFSPALNPNHGTGKHIHVGYYQTGGSIVSPYRPLPQSDNTSVFRPAYVSQPQLDANKELARQANAKVVAKRKANIAEADQARTENPQNFVQWANNFGKTTQAIGDKFRTSLNDNFFDDYINPVAWIGRMASKVGQMPMNTLTGNFSANADAITEPLLAGAMGFDPLGANIKAGKQALPAIQDFITEQAIRRRHAGLAKYMTNPITKQRFNELGVTAEGNFQNIDVPRLRFGSGRYGSYYSPEENIINIDLKQARKLKTEGYDLNPKSIYDHERAHYFQQFIKNNSYKAYEAQHKQKLYEALGNKFGELPPGTFTPEEAVSTYTDILKAQKRAGLYWFTGARTELDNLSNHLTPHDFTTALGESSRAYFHSGQEPMAHLSELRSSMIQNGYVKNETSPISSAQILNFLLEHPKDRIASFLSMDENNIIDLKYLLNKLPAAAPVIGVGAAAAASQKKKGGSIYRPKR